MSKQTARAILDLSFPTEDVARMRQLAAKNKEGELTDEEELQLDHFCRVGRTLTILKSRAAGFPKACWNCARVYTSYIHL